MLISFSHKLDYASKNFTVEDITKGCIYLVIMLVIIYIIGNILSNKEKYITKKASKFLKQFNNSLEKVPSTYDIEQFVQSIKYKHITNNLLKKIILFPLIYNKIILIHNMDILEKYRTFYKNNISEVSLGILSTYNVIPGDFYDMLNSDIALNELLSYNHIEIKLVYSNNNNDPILKLYFNQKLIFKDILLKSFLETGKDNDYVKKDIIQEITNNTKDKNKLLLDVITNTIKN